jgi:hypothetical protein
MGLTIETDTHPPVFFVPFAAALGKRVADTGLMLDAASRGSTSGELNTETQRAQRLREDGTAVDVTEKPEWGRVGRGWNPSMLRASMKNGSMKLARR